MGFGFGLLVWEIWIRDQSLISWVRFLNYFENNCLIQRKVVLDDIINRMPLVLSRENLCTIIFINSGRFG